MDPTSLAPSPKWATYSSTFVSANAIKLSVATSVAAAAYSGGALDGAVGAGAIGLLGQPAGNTTGFPQRVTATTAAHAATYKTGAANAIVVVGTIVDDQGQSVAQTDSILLTATNGGETVSTTKSFSTVTSISVPAQNDALGAFTFGVGDIQPFRPFRQVRGGADGNLQLVLPDGTQDTTPVLLGEKHDCAVARVVAAGTTFPITAFA